MERKCTKLLLFVFLLTLSSCHTKIKKAIQQQFLPQEEGMTVIDIQDLFPNHTIDSIFIIGHGPLPDSLIGEIIGMENYHGYGFLDLQDDMQRIILLSSGRVLYQENFYSDNNCQFGDFYELNDRALYNTHFVIKKSIDEKEVNYKVLQ